MAQYLGAFRFRCASGHEHFMESQAVACESAPSVWVTDELSRLVNAHHHDGIDGEVRVGHDSIFTKCGACKLFSRRVMAVLVSREDEA